MYRILRALIIAVLMWPSAGWTEIRDLTDRRITVLAVEYPPFTSQYLPAEGSAYRVLRDQLEYLVASEPPGFDIVPKFLPPARAHHRMLSGRWSASFYPPRHRADHIVRFELDAKPIELGVFRLRRLNNDRPFADPPPGPVWSGLESLQGRIAVGRLWLEDRSESNPLLQAGLTLVPVDSLYQGFKLLNRGRVEYVFSERTAGYYMQRYVADRDVLFEFNEQPLYTTTMGIWLNLDDPKGAQLYHALQSRPRKTPSE